MKNNECCEVVIVGAAHTDLQLYPVGADVLDTASYSVKQMVLTVGGDALNEATAYGGGRDILWDGDRKSSSGKFSLQK